VRGIKMGGVVPCAALLPATPFELML